MEKNIYFLFLFLLSHGLSCQDVSKLNVSNPKLTMVNPLPLKLAETSGLAAVYETLWTHNDGQSGPFIYQIDRSSGRILKDLKVQNAKNLDWEDMDGDDEYLYIADTGNNNIKRSRFQIYVISTESLKIAESDINVSYTIDFTYQKNKSPNCEAIAILGEQILLFTKTSKSETDIYSLDKKAGSQKAKKWGEIYSFGQITGACFAPEIHTLVLTGYRKISEKLYKPFLWKILPNGMKPEKWTTALINLELSAQIEAITYIGEGEFLLSSEKSDFLPPRLFSFQDQ